jgi:catechol 2,3-dioxygenase-like lactoylglutathione lyase family enzyme
MLANCPVIGFVPTSDTARAQNFYQNTLGLRFISEDPFALVFEAAGTMIRVVRVDQFTPAPFTILGWDVADIDETVHSLAAKGVQFHQYGLPGQAPNAVWKSPDGSAKVAWFPDPDGNTLSISQHIGLTNDHSLASTIQREAFKSAIRQAMNLSKEEMNRLLEEEKTAHRLRQKPE